MTADAQPLLVDCDTAARMLTISPRLLRQLVARGQVVPCRIGRLVRFSPAVLQSFIESRMEPDA